MPDKLALLLISTPLWPCDAENRSKDWHIDYSLTWNLLTNLVIKDKQGVVIRLLVAWIALSNSNLLFYSNNYLNKILNKLKFQLQWIETQNCLIFCATEKNEEMTKFSSHRPSDREIIRFSISWRDRSLHNEVEYSRSPLHIKKLY